MPKFDDYDDTAFPMSPRVQMNVDARVAAGGWSCVKFFKKQRSKE